MGSGLLFPQRSGEFCALVMVSMVCVDLLLHFLHGPIIGFELFEQRGALQFKIQQRGLELLHEKLVFGRADLRNSLCRRGRELILAQPGSASPFP